MKKVFLIILFVFICTRPAPVFSLEPDEVLVVANKRMAGSVDLAEYYMEKRRIPSSHLLPLTLGLNETMIREEYDNVLVKEVRAAIERLKPESRIAAVVLMYGVPLKVAPPLPDFNTMEQVKQYRKEKSGLIQKKESDTAASVTKESQDGELHQAIKTLSEKIQSLLNTDQRASVDSELALVKAGKYELKDWIPNPYYLGFQARGTGLSKDKVILVCRLDGPDIQTVRRIIDDTLWAEQNGLSGHAYFDARWKKPENPENLGAYRLYDYSLHKAAELAGKRMDVVLDDNDALFPEGACADAALYCGWYSLTKYIDSFTWKRGAIGYHIASGECTTLRNTESSVWCLKMLEKGVAATIGPVHEPYVQGFPVPQVFFGHLLEGYMSLGEAYLVSLPYLSWQMVLVGDPLYQPFSPFPDLLVPEKPAQQADGDQ